MQNVIELLHSHSIIDSSIQNPESHRFLADFTLFLIQQHNELKVDAKCQLISDYVKKISASFLDEALKSIGEEGNGNIRDAIPPDDKAGIEASPNDFQDVAMVGLDAMQRANSTLEDFMRSYLMFHKMDVHQPQSIFRYLPILSFAESFIYQITVEDVMRAVHLKSFDYRVLNLILYGLRGEELF